MSKKDYEAIAYALSQTRPERRQRTAYSQWKTDVLTIIAVFAADNPRFDSSRFNRAVGLEE